jgi:hypothetical protein
VMQHRKFGVDRPSSARFVARASSRKARAVLAGASATVPMCIDPAAHANRRAVPFGC